MCRVCVFGDLFAEQGKLWTLLSKRSEETARMSRKLRFYKFIARKRPSAALTTTATSLLSPKVSKSTSTTSTTTSTISSDAAEDEKALIAHWIDACVIDNSQSSHRLRNTLKQLQQEHSSQKRLRGLTPTQTTTTSTTTTAESIRGTKEGIGSGSSATGAELDDSSSERLVTLQLSSSACFHGCMIACLLAAAAAPACLSFALRTRVAGGGMLCCFPDLADVLLYGLYYHQRARCDCW